MAKGKAKKKGKVAPKKAPAGKVKAQPKPPKPFVKTKPLKIKSYTPVKVNCPFCKKTMTTRVVYKRKRGFICKMIMRIFACCLPCCLRCTGSFKDAQHYCTNCKRLIAINSW